MSSRRDRKFYHNFGTDFLPFGTVLMISGHVRACWRFYQHFGTVQKRGRKRINYLGQFVDYPGQSLNILGLTVNSIRINHCRLNGQSDRPQHSAEKGFSAESPFQPNASAQPSYSAGSNFSRMLRLSRTIRLQSVNSMIADFDGTFTVVTASLP